MINQNDNENSNLSNSNVSKSDMVNEIIRKDDHVKLAENSQLNAASLNNEFNYEPLFSSHKTALNNKSVLERTILNKKVKAPLWISSMTGGGEKSKHLNYMFAEIAAEFGLGMGLGSCRPLLTSSDKLDEFNVRKVIGNDLPLVANIGQGQVEELIQNQELNRLNDIVSDLSADALVFHINPLQEWFQPGGDIFSADPIEIIKILINKIDKPIIVKEVGQGFGPRSLQALMELPLAAIEFGAYGGTNFSYLESLRTEKERFDPLCFVGHTAEEMVGFINQIVDTNFDKERIFPKIIISGGVQNYLHAYKLMEMANFEALYAQAGKILFAAEKSKNELRNYIKTQIDGLLMANGYLTLKNKVTRLGESQ